MNEGVKVHFPLPSEKALSFCWVAEQETGRMEMSAAYRTCRTKKDILDFCGTEISGVDFDDALPRLNVDRVFVLSRPFPPDA